MLFVVAGAWLMFAMVQDVKTREVANWLTFSLIAIGLAYRAFLSMIVGAWNVLLWGILGGVVFVGLAYALYYGRVFAGGDAKLLMGTGIALPYAAGDELLSWGSLFIVLLLTAGAFYTLVYSFVLVTRSRRKFRKTFHASLQEARSVFALAFVAAVALALIGVLTDQVAVGAAGSVIVLALPCVYVYLRAVEKSCLQRACKAEELREGDWLAKGVMCRGRKIEASVHGLSQADIALLKQARKSVIIKEGIVFVPAFVLAYGLMVYVAAISEIPWAWAWSVLSSLVEAFL